MGFTAIALESGFTESRTVDSFVGGAPGDARRVARAGLTSGFDRFTENRDLIQWMRDYNATATVAGHRRIRFYGIDLTGGAGRLSGPRRAVDDALTFLSRADPMTADRIRASLDVSLPRSDDDQVGSLPAATLDKFDSSITAIDDAIKINRSNLLAHSSFEEYRWALHDLDVARQLANYLRLIARVSSMNDLRDAGPVMGARDYAMAENVRWAVENEGPQGRLLVFAHDAHVMNWKLDGGIFDVVRDKPFMMGSYLRRVYGNDLFIMATSSATASAALPTPEPIQGSIDSALARIGLPAMILDIRLAPLNTEAAAWLSTPRPLLANLSSHILITPSSAADAFFFVRRLTPASGAPIAGRFLNELHHYPEFFLAAFGAPLLVILVATLTLQRRRKPMSS